MEFIADECIDKPVVEHLRQEGFEVIYIAEQAPSLPDSKVLDLANSIPAALITSDKDFGELVFRQRKMSQGVVLLRLAGIPAVKQAEIVSAALKKHSNKIKGYFTVVTVDLIRIRRI